MRREADTFQPVHYNRQDISILHGVALKARISSKHYFQCRRKRALSTPKQSEVPQLSLRLDRYRLEKLTLRVMRRGFFSQPVVLFVSKRL